MDKEEIIDSEDKDLFKISVINGFTEVIFNAVELDELNEVFIAFLSVMGSSENFRNLVSTAFLTYMSDPDIVEKIKQHTHGVTPPDFNKLLKDLK